MSDYIDEVFGLGGALAQKFDGYQPREGQIAMVRAVDAAITQHGHLIAEAGTGTGKSLAYLVPAIHHAMKAAERSQPKPAAVIVTANIALQEQLVRKDLPLLKEILPWDFQYALLKGKNNFLCLDKLHGGAFGEVEKDDFEMNREIDEWARTTTTGDISDLPFEPPYRLWNRFSVSSDECIGKECEYYRDCYSENARRKAQAANIVVTNYHLFFADMQVRRATGGMVSLLPSYGIAILDEGHKAVDIARDFFGFRITEGSLRWASSMLPYEVKLEIEPATEAFFSSLLTFKRSGEYKARLRKPNAVATEMLTTALRKAEVAYREMLAPLFGEDASSYDRKEAIKLARRLNRVEVLREQIQTAMRLYALPKAPWRSHPDAEGWYFSDPGMGGDNSVATLEQLAKIEDVFFIEEDGGKAILSSKPISVAERLAEELFEETGSVTVTSATLAVRSSFEYVAQDFGVAQRATLIAQSPFAWREQALLVTPQDVPEPSDPTFIQEAARRCVETIEYARGRTLALFTSYRNMNAAHERALKTKWRVLRQGDMPRTKLIDEFRRDTNSCLFGVESFWAGVDVPGESLSCVFIDKLPFVTPEDPIMDALTERERDWFMKYSVPRAIIAFKQGFGRLIRTTSDKGVVVCLDRRITTKFYGRHFLDSLPPVQRSFNLQDVQRFLDGESLVLTPPVMSYGGGSMLG